MSDRTQADRELDWSTGRELERKDAEIARLTAQVERQRQALEDVVNPLGALKRHAEAQGSRLNGMAYQIANSIGYLQDIAKRALSSDDRAG